MLSKLSKSQHFRTCLLQKWGSRREKGSRYRGILLIFMYIFMVVCVWVKASAPRFAKRLVSNFGSWKRMENVWLALVVYLPPQTDQHSVLPPPN